MKYFYTLLLGCLVGLTSCSLAAQAQAPAWSAATSGGTQLNGGSQIQATAVDGAGNVFVAGYFAGQIAFGTTMLTSAGDNDLFVGKYVPATGTWAWAQRGGGTADDRALGIAVSGTSVYVTGYLINNSVDANGVRFGGTSPATSLVLQRGASSVTAQDIIVAKYTDNGMSASLGWTQIAGGTSNDVGRAIAASGSSIYLTGNIVNNTANANAVVFGGTGTTAGTTPQYGATSISSSDIVVAKYIDNGLTATVSWTQVGGGTSNDSGYGIAVSNTNVYVTGALLNTTTNTYAAVFGGAGTTVGTAPQYGASTAISRDVVLAKYTDNGSAATFGWSQVAGGSNIDEGYAVAVSGTSVYLTGYITNSIANTNAVLFGGTGTTAGTLRQNGASSSSGYDLVVAKYTDNGSAATVGWTQVGGGTDQDAGYAVTASGNAVYVTGAITTTASNANGVVFGGTGTTAGTVPQNGLTNGVISTRDILVARYTDNGTTAGLNWTQVAGGGGLDNGLGVALSGSSLYVAGNIYEASSTSSEVAFFGTATGSPILGTQGQRAVLGQLSAGPGTWQTVTVAANGGNSQTHAAATDASGNVFVTGWFNGQVTFGSTTLNSVGADDWFVAKYVPTTSTWAWATSGGGTGSDTGYGIAVSGNNVYVTGQYRNTSANKDEVVFGGTGPTTSTTVVNGITSAEIGNLLLVKYTDNGTTVSLGWTQVAGGRDGAIGYGLATSGTSVYLVGALANDLANTSGVVFGGNGSTPGTAAQSGASSASSSDIVVAKYTDNGASATFNWSQVGGGTGVDLGFGIAVSNSKIYITGFISNTALNANAVLFGGTGTTPGTVPQYGASVSANNDIILAKYTDNGSSATLGWTQVGGGTNFDYGRAVAVSGNSVYVAGSIFNNRTNGYGVVFGGTGTTLGTVQQNGTSIPESNDIILAKYTDNGSSATLGWTQIGGGNNGDAASSVTAIGTSVYVAGYIFNSTTNTNGVLFGGSGTTAGTVVVNGTSSTSNGAVLVAKYTDNGPSATLGWTQVGGAGNAYGMALGGQSIYAVGYVLPPVAFGNFAITSPPLTITNFLAQLIDGPVAPLAVTATATPSSLLLYPNPAHTPATLTGAAPSTLVQVRNVLGQLVATTTTDAAGTARLSAGLTAGIYMVTCGSQTLRLTVE